MNGDENVELWKMLHKLDRKASVTANIVMSSAGFFCGWLVYRGALDHLGVGDGMAWLIGAAVYVAVFTMYRRDIDRVR